MDNITVKVQFLRDCKHGKKNETKEITMLQDEISLLALWEYFKVIEPEKSEKIPEKVKAKK